MSTTTGGAHGPRIPVEELIEFPTAFSFKVIGHHTLAFTQRAFDAAQGALGEGRKVELRTRLSRKATYISATLTARIESADELKAVYAALRKLEGTITVL